MKTPILRIVNFDRDEDIELSRDVRHVHPTWVHRQLGTRCESELQLMLDQYDPSIFSEDDTDICGVYVEWR
jgi:hypothetical protein